MHLLLSAGRSEALSLAPVLASFFVPMSPSANGPAWSATLLFGGGCIRPSGNKRGAECPPSTNSLVPKHKRHQFDLKMGFPPRPPSIQQAWPRRESVCGPSISASSRSSSSRSMSIHAGTACELAGDLPRQIRSPLLSQPGDCSILIIICAALGIPTTAWAFRSACRTSPTLPNTSSL